MHSPCIPCELKLVQNAFEACKLGSRSQPRSPPVRVRTGPVPGLIAQSGRGSTRNMVMRLLGASFGHELAIVVSKILHFLPSTCSQATNAFPWIGMAIPNNNEDPSSSWIVA